jgi:hypothetical protein
MKKKSLTIEELREKVWWWGWKEFQDGVPGVHWELAEKTARNYELMRRSPKGAKFKKSYSNLNPNERAFLYVLWSEKTAQPYRFANNAEQYNEIGWTPVSTNPPRQWNLKLPDSVLSKIFLKEIRFDREIQKILPEHALKGKAHRGISWSYIELLDRQKNGHGRFTDGERHMASDGKKMATKFFNEFDRALNDWKRSAKESRDCRLLKSSEMVDFTKPPVPWNEIDWQTVTRCTISEFFNFQLIHS